MSFIKIMSLYDCRRIVSFVMDVDKFIVTDVPADVTALPFVTNFSYVLCFVMVSACMIIFWVHNAMGIKIVVCTIVGSNRELYLDGA